MVGVIQRHVDLSISKTVNLPNVCTVQEIEGVYIYAWELGCKGITVYRDGCRDNQVLTTGVQGSDDNSNLVKLNHIKPITRSELGEALNGQTYSKHVACGKLYITLNRDDNNNIVEVFVDTGKSGGCEANAQCLGRLFSVLCRSGVAIESIVDSIKGVRCGACEQIKGSKSKKIDGISCGDVLAKVLDTEYKRLNGTGKKSDKVDKTDMACPDCGEIMQMAEGCVKCANCNYSKCN
jgi:ribonucleoside-diphosphate reductase alpha chain